MEVQCFEIKTEADSNDITLCSDDDKPSTGMFTVTDSRGLVVTSGTLTEPSSQLIHSRRIDEEIKSNQTQKPTFTELELNLKALNTQIEPNTSIKEPKLNQNPIFFTNSCPVDKDVRQGILSSQNFGHIAENVPLNTLSQNSVHIL